MDDFLGAFRAGDGLQDLAGIGSDHRDRRLNAQRGANPLSGHDHPPRQRRGTALQPVQIADPLVDRMPPQHDSVERIAGDEFPVAGQVRREDAPFVVDVEHLPVAAHASRDAGHFVVMARPARPADPLQVRQRRLQRLVLRHGIPGRVIQLVRPVVHRCRARFDEHLRADEGRPFRRQHAENFLPRHRLRPSTISRLTKLSMNGSVPDCHWPTVILPCNPAATSVSRACRASFSCATSRWPSRFGHCCSSDRNSEASAP